MDYRVDDHESVLGWIEGLRRLMFVSSIRPRIGEAPHMVAERIHAEAPGNGYFCPLRPVAPELIIQAMRSGA